MYFLLVKLTADNGYWLATQSNDKKDIDNHVGKYLDKKYNSWSVLEHVNVSGGQRWFASLEQAQMFECKAMVSDNMDRDKTKQENAKHLTLIKSLADPTEPKWTLFLGDSILEHVSSQLHQTGHSIVAAVGGDRTEHLLWRIVHGELASTITNTMGKVNQIVLLIGHNNLERDDAADIFAAICKISQMLMPLTRQVTLVLPIPPCQPSEKGKYKNRQLEFYEKWSGLNKMISSLNKNVAEFFDDFKNAPDLYIDNIHFSDKGNQVFLSCLGKLLNFTSLEPDLGRCFDLNLGLDRKDDKILDPQWKPIDVSLVMADFLGLEPSSAEPSLKSNILELEPIKLEKERDEQDMIL